MICKRKHVFIRLIWIARYLVPISYDNAVRIELWGDEIDSIRFFDIDSQLSLEEIDVVKRGRNYKRSSCFFCHFN